MFLLLVSGFTLAQDKLSWETYYERLTDVDGIESGSWEAAYEVLSELAEHPFDLNEAKREDLEQLPFLTPQQVEELVEYLDRYAPIRSWGELAMIETLDATRRKLLSFFVTLGTEQQDAFPSAADIMKHGRHELLFTGKVPFYKRQGDEKGYLGYPYKHWWRYNFKYGQYVNAGLVGSQDAGEPWFAGRNKWGYDYYSYYLQLRNWGRLKSMVIGRYRLKFGLGVGMNRDFGFGKLATLSALGGNTNTIRSQSSRSEANYMQGIAATVSVARGLDLTGFASYRKIDGTLRDDGGTAIATIVKTGYHRTEREMARKHNAAELVAGGHAQYFKNGFHVGMTAFHTSLDRPLHPKTEQLYRQHDVSGKLFWNASVDYGYVSRKLSIQGETATGDCRALATVHYLSYQCTSTWSVMAVQRFYSYKYHSLFSQSFSEGGKAQNESSVYLGANWHASRHLSLMAYVDYAYFPWARYRVCKTSSAWDCLLTGNYQRRKWQLEGRYRLRLREKDNAEKSALLPERIHQGRLSVAFDDGRWLFKTQCHLSHHDLSAKSFGYMIAETMGCRRRRLRAFANIGYFNTHDFNSRIYSYERGLLYTFAFPVFSGEGLRYAINVRWDADSKLMLMAKLGATHYFDRDKTGSSYQQVNQSSQTDLEMQLRWRF